MQFEEFNKKVKDAADQHHPAYDEKAWQKMQKLLDEHMPQQKEDRRRFLLWLLPFLLLGGGLFVTITKPWNPSSNSRNEQQVVTPKSNQNSSENSSAVIETGKTKVEQAADEAANSNTNTQQDINPLQLASTSKTNSPKTNTGVTTKTAISKQNQPAPAEEQPVSKNYLSDNKNEVTPVTPTDPLTNLLQQKQPENKSEEVKTDLAKSTVVENKEPQPGKTKSTDKKKQGNNFLSGFGISVAAGPDASKVGNSSMGKTTVAYGAAISYTWNRFTLRTGVFSATKLYTADEDDYDLNYNLPPTIKFEGADADCRVTEIPVLISYNFADTKKSNWFASTGLSTYLMKRESYTYWYSNNSTGAYYPKFFEFRDQNKHYFSVANLSAGYTRKLNDHVTISAEPYIKIPLQGVGQGQVHLNSAGIMFSVGVKPFTNNQKK
jgi:hypothetical protein